MKRSSCLSAFLVGALSLTTATAALAAPPTGTEKQPVKQVAQLSAQPSGDGTPSTGTTAPAPTDDTSTQPQPAVSVGIGTSTTAPTADVPAAAAPTPANKPAKRPFAGSSAFFQQSMTTGTVFRGQTLDYNPTVESSLFLLPRYAINDAFQLRGRVIVSYEETNADNTNYKNEPQLSDTTLSLFYKKIPTLPGGIQAAVALNAGFPTSKTSRARTMVVSPGATLQLVKGFENVLGGELMLLGSTTYTHPFYSSRNPEVVDARPRGAFTCVGGNNCSDLLSGTMNPSDSLSYALLVSMEWGKWNPALYYLGASQWTYSPTEVKNPYASDGSNVGRPAGVEGPTSVRQTHYFSAWLDYNFNTWLTGEVGFWNATNALTGSGKYSNPFWNSNADTRVYLGASFQLDNLVKAIQGGEEGEAGVVRAKNTKAPMWTF